MSERSVPAEQIGNDICQEPWLSRAQRERYQGLWALLLLPAGENSSVLCSLRVSSHLYGPCTPPITGSSVSARLPASVIMCSVVSVSSYMKLEQNLLLITTSFCSHLKCTAHLMLMLSACVMSIYLEECNSFISMQTIPSEKSFHHCVYLNLAHILIAYFSQDIFFHVFKCGVFLLSLSCGVLRSEKGLHNVEMHLHQLKGGDWG